MGKTTTADEMKHITGARCSTTVRRANRLVAVSESRPHMDNVAVVHGGSFVADRTVLSTDTPDPHRTKQHHIPKHTDALFAEIERQSRKHTLLPTEESIPKATPVDSAPSEHSIGPEDCYSHMDQRTVPTWQYTSPLHPQITPVCVCYRILPNIPWCASEVSDRSLPWQLSPSVSPAVPSAPENARVRQRSKALCFSPVPTGSKSAQTNQESCLYSPPFAHNPYQELHLNSRMEPSKGAYKPLSSSLMVPRKRNKYLPTPVATTGTIQSPSSTLDGRRNVSSANKDKNVSFRIFAEPFSTKKGGGTT